MPLFLVKLFELPPLPAMDDSLNDEGKILNN